VKLLDRDLLGGIPSVSFFPAFVCRLFWRPAGSCCGVAAAGVERAGSGGGKGEPKFAIDRAAPRPHTYFGHPKTQSPCSPHPSIESPSPLPRQQDKESAGAKRSTPLSFHAHAANARNAGGAPRARAPIARGYDDCSSPPPAQQHQAYSPRQQDSSSATRAGDGGRAAPAPPAEPSSSRRFGRRQQPLPVAARVAAAGRARRPPALPGPARVQPL
jgi:hypothetical protein